MIVITDEHMDKRYRTAMRGPFSLRPTTDSMQRYNGRRWAVYDARNKWVCGTADRALIDEALARLELLYAEWLLYKP